MKASFKKKLNVRLGQVHGIYCSKVLSLPITTFSAHRHHNHNFIVMNDEFEGTSNYTVVAQSV
jgi:hypothetical protein